MFEKSSLVHRAPFRYSALKQLTFLKLRVFEISFEVNAPEAASIFDIAPSIAAKLCTHI